jgi:hypothetical protein
MAFLLSCLNFEGLSQSTRAEGERISRMLRNPDVDNPDAIPPIQKQQGHIEMATIGGENVVVHDDAAQIPSI